MFAYARGEAELGAFRKESDFLGVEVISEVGDQIGLLEVTSEELVLLLSVLFKLVVLFL